MAEYCLIKGKLLNSSVDFGAWSDVAPVLQLQVGIVLSAISGFPQGTYYNSASGYDQNIYCFAIFNQEPNIKQGNYNTPEMVSATYDSTSGLWYYRWYFQGWNRLLNDPMGADIPFYHFNTSNMWNYIFTQQEPPYNWQSVPSISGKNGISLLSIIKSSAINSGDAVSGASEDAFDRLEETTKISTLIQGISEETPIIYSDDVNYMSITPTANNTCTLKFYLHGSVIYTLTDVNINAYLSFLIDETNGIMKPSIIYEDS